MKTWLAVTSGLALMTCSIAQGSSVLDPGSLAQAPYPDRPVQVVVIANGVISQSPGDTIIEQSVARLKASFKVRLNQRVLAGYILNTDMKDDEATLAGYDLDKHVTDKWFAPWFHNPMPSNPEMTKYISDLWAYATGTATDPNRPKANAAFADSEIDHVFFPQSKFGAGSYQDQGSGIADDWGFESVLHEAIHIWHFRHLDLVAGMLKSSGSYFDRVQASEKACPSYQTVSLQFSGSNFCGFTTRRAAMDMVLNAGHWPQRFGDRTERLSTILKDSYGCSAFGGTEVTINGQTHCLQKNEDSLIGDLHSIDNEYEYFAIMMQLYIFSPNDFAKIATPTETAFAKQMFDGDFR